MKPQQRKGSDPQPRAGITRFWWVLLIALMAWHLVAFIPRGQTPASITYTDFIAQVKADNVTQVTISGDHKGAAGDASWHRRERPVGKFERVLTFPAPLDADKVEARLENGVLHLTLPKAEEARPRPIQVTGG